MRASGSPDTREPIPLTEFIVFDPESGDIRRDTVILDRLSDLQTRAFEHIVDSPDMVVSFEELERFMYPGEGSGLTEWDDRERLQNVMQRVRRRLDAIDHDLSLRLETIPSRGYRWRVAITDNSEE